MEELLAQVAAVGGAVGSLSRGVPAAEIAAAVEILAAEVSAAGVAAIVGDGRPPVRVVAFGGGHGLSATLRALRRLQADVPLDITAVVTVADDGGSSGRLRQTRDILPPGDLRQALAALADETAMAELFQHRFDGADEIAGHPVGNLVLCALMELAGDPVAALDQAASMLRCGGRVLPMSRQPLHIEADLSDGGEVVTVRGQHEVAVTPKTIDRVRLTPAEPEACAEAVWATENADWLLFGPGSWFTSVIPHLLVPSLADAIRASRAKRLVTLNLAADSETAGLTLPEHLAALHRYLPGLQVDVVLADGKAVGDPEPVHRAAESLGARLVLAPVAVLDGSPRHDPLALAAALEPLIRRELENREVTTEWR
ncbi:uridine diphosphate-N-acetylglucosamine-binding protein YvcK [Dactylosporangium sucinum]|uniref:Putative gluconeogenesis factor n=1 Tax=Dactylosporangium sucinum TaxID=1424081 RepID=A0A917WL23_9ACTN|nr:uridine diphosphate-N-acetylglucosamine-binding protein YvcK [Dactylosporangium sucinum]GGM12636.1 putative gluconeogenesis factor [Dactylosporangium sucinum]